MQQQQQQQRRQAKQAWWAGVIIIALVLVAGCGISTSHGASASTTKYATPIATPALVWQKRLLPPNAAGWAISPVNGRDVWACAPDQGDNFTIWASHDAAATWAKVGHLAPATPQPTTACSLVADQHATKMLIAVISWGAGANDTLRAISLLSTDGGVTWRKMPSEAVVSDLATIAGKTYAILYDTSAPTIDESSVQLVVSADGLHTWRRLRPAQLVTTDSFFDFRLGPQPGELMGATYQDSLWRTVNDGASWSRISAPTDQINLFRWLPQVGYWMLCTGTGSPPTATCSVDLGKTWQRAPLLSATTVCAECSKTGKPVSETQPCVPGAITNNGSLVTICIDGTAHLLAPHAQTWTPLGPSPAGGFSILADSQLWCWDSAQYVFFTATLPA